MKKFIPGTIIFFGLSIWIYHSSTLWTSSRSSFHQDEYQHVHIAWNSLNGKLIYKDFFDTHGPISAWIFSFLLKFKNGEIASIDSLFFLRTVCLVFVYISAALLFCCLQLLNLNLPLNILTVGLFLGQLTTQVTAFRIRPDIFMLASFLSFLILWLKERRFYSGIFLGITLGLNPKFIVFNIPILLLDIFSEKKVKGSKWTLLSGQLIVFLIISCIQGYQGNLLDSWNNQFLTNFQTVATRMPFSGSRFALLQCFLELDSFLLFSLAAFVLWIITLVYRSKIELDRNFKMILLLSICGVLYLAAPMAHHGLLLSIPCFLMLISYVVDRSFQDKLKGQSLIALLVIITTYISYKELPKYNSDLNPNFSSLTKALAEIPRTQPILYIWPNRCPAYVFNSDHGKYWAQLVRTPEMDRGRDINRFADPKITWVALDDVMFNFLIPTEKDYLANNFVKFDCLWQRK